MAANHSKEPKCCCISCGKEFYTIYFNKHFKSCKKKCLKEGTQKIPCPICGIKLREINTSHLRSHDIDLSTFKELYPDCETLSLDSRGKKNTLSYMTPELSQKLKYGHTLEAKIQKYGEEEGTRRHKASLESYSRSKTKKGYIEKWGEEEGTKRWEERLKKVSLSSKKAWSNPSRALRIRGTLKGYRNKWGEEEGRRRWLRSCNKKSESLRRIPKSLTEDYRLYKSLVLRVSKLNMKMYNPDLISGRSVKLHVDHKYSCLQGFLDLTSPYFVGYINNLELLPRSQNCSKQHKCSQTLVELKREITLNGDYCKLIYKDMMGINSIFFEIVENVKQSSLQ